MIIKNDYMECSEISEKYNVSEEYIRELCRRGKYDKEAGIVAVKFGKKWRVPISEIERKLGKKDTDEIKCKDVYINNLERELEIYKIKLKTLNLLVESIVDILK